MQYLHLILAYSNNHCIKFH